MNAPSMPLPASARTFITLAGISGFLMVALGAFGAHLLENAISADQLKIWETAVKYQMVHTVALLALALLFFWKSNSALRWAGWLFVEGIVLFSGSLYIYAVTDISWLGMITPFGGIAFLAAWILLIVGSLQKRSS